MNRIHTFLLIAGAVAMALVAFALLRPADPPLPDVDGTYRNACCAPLTIAGGTIETPQRAISFTLERGKLGVVLIPDKYLGVAAGQGLDIDTDGAPMMLRYRVANGRAVLVLPGRDSDHEFVRAPDARP